MASEEGVPATAVVVAEEVAARSAELVRALLQPGPGGSRSVEESADVVAFRDRAFVAWMAREYPTASLEDVDALAVAAAAGSLVVAVHQDGRSLNAPQNVVEEAVIKAVAMGAAVMKSAPAGDGHQVGAMTTSPAHGSAFQDLIAAIFMGVVIAIVVGLGCH